MRNETEWKKAVENELKKSYNEPHMTEGQVEKMKEKMQEAKLENRREQKKKVPMRIATVAAAAVAAFVILPNTSANIAYAMEQIPVLGKLVEVVTFRDYEYESDRYLADIEVPQLTAQIIKDEVATLPEEQTQQMNVEVEEKEVQENLQKTTEEINAEIQKITEQIIAEFEQTTLSQEGYQDVLVNSEVISTTEDYFTLKLNCYKGEASGYEWNYFYTIDLKTGERLQLKALFQDGTDYITPISENIKTQMREQMAADEMIYYWLDDEDMKEWNFEEITDETSFYVNEIGNVVISFNEGDVAPMYMGVVEFEIPAEVLAEIRK